eukprot:5618285-Prymnesium_polylepis.1
MGAAILGRAHLADEDAAAVVLEDLLHRSGRVLPHAGHRRAAERAAEQRAQAGRRILEHQQRNLLNGRRAPVDGRVAHLGAWWRVGAHVGRLLGRLLRLLGVRVQPKRDHHRPEGVECAHRRHAL